MKNYKIATIAGDGIGKEVVPEGIKILKEVAKKHQFQIQFDDFDFASCDYYKKKGKIYDAEVLESSSIDENIVIKILIRAGRTIAKPALEVLEMALDPFTPTQVRVSLMAALAYLIMPFDLFPDFMPLVGYSDDFVALTAVLSIWSRYMTPAIRERAERKLNKLFPFVK